MSTLSKCRQGAKLRAHCLESAIGATPVQNNHGHVARGTSCRRQRYRRPPSLGDVMRPSFYTNWAMALNIFDEVRADLEDFKSAENTACSESLSLSVSQDDSNAVASEPVEGMDTEEPALECVEHREKAKAASRQRQNPLQHRQNPRKVKHTCPVCSTVCTGTYSFSRHMATHNAEKKHKCLQCTFQTNRSYSFTKHMAGHERVRPSEDARSPRSSEDPRSPRSSEDPRSPRSSEDPRSPRSSEDPRSPRSSEDSRSPWPRFCWPRSLIASGPSPSSTSSSRSLPPQDGLRNAEAKELENPENSSSGSLQGATNGKSGAAEEAVATTRQTSFPCDTCGKIYSHRKSLKRHTLEHGPYTLFCEICNAGFHRRENHLRHSQKCLPKPMPVVVVGPA